MKSQALGRAIFASVGFVLVLGANSRAFAQGVALGLSPNVDTSMRLGNEAEGAVVVDPTNPNRLFMFSNSDSAGGALRGAFSVDGGVTWTPRDMCTGGDGLVLGCCDPTAAWDTFGNLFIAYISSTLHTIVGLSTNGGASFTQIADLAASTDQPTIVVGPGGGVAPGSVWVCYNVSGTMRARGAPVTGLGAAAVGPFIAEQAGGSGSFGDIAVGPAGQVMIVQAPSSGQGPATISGNLDANGLAAGGFGATFSITPTNVGGFDFIPAQNSRSVDAESGLAWDRTGGPHNGRLYLVYTDETVNENNDTEVLVRYSDNNGTTWSGPVRVHDDPVGPIRSQFNPKIAIDQTTGVVSVVWYDCRNDAGGVGGAYISAAANDEPQLFGTVTTNAGLSFRPNVIVGPGVSFAPAAANGVEFGDYIGLACHGGRFYPVWADNSGTVAGNPQALHTKFDQLTARVTIRLCRADVAPAPWGDGAVNVTDLLAIIGAWGACPAPPALCPSDTNADGTINVTDLLAVIGAWGPCP